MSGVVNSEGAVSGVIGTTVGAAAGSTLQIVTHSGTNESVLSSTSGTWGETDLTKAITPTYSNSKIMIYMCTNISWTNDSSDGGFAARIRRNIAGGATNVFPDNLSRTEDGQSLTGVVYQEAPERSGKEQDNYTFIQIDEPGVAGVAVTYTLFVGGHTHDWIQVGGMKFGRWFMYLMEIKV